MYATTEGVVRAPSEFSMTLGVLPSMMATQLFVVPRSMPMILLMLNCLRASEWWVAWLCKWGFSTVESTCGAGRRRFGRLGHGDQRGAQDPIVDEVALLENVDDRVRRQVAVDGHHRLVLVRVELLSRRIDFLDLDARKRGGQRLQREIGARFERLGGHRRIRGKCLLQRVLDGEQILGKFFDRVLVRPRHVRLA